MQLIKFFSRADVFSYLLLWLIFLLISGTIAQKEIGLYAATKQYFSAYFIWIFNIIPIPAGYSIMGLITFSLICKLLNDKWHKNKIGTIITHIGALLLMIGGIITAIFSYEGNMLLKEGKSSNFISDYHHSELVIKHNGKEQNFSNLKNGQIINFADQKLIVKNYYENCDLTTNPNPQKHQKSLARIFNLKKKNLFKINEENIPCLSFEIIGYSPEINGIYNIFENMPIKQIISNHQLELRRIRSYLPFEIKLIDFQKDSYKSTDIAKNYTSIVNIKDGNNNWQAVITMNKPLRYKGYSFYQSSFINNNGEEMSILAVVKNYGRLFPYISSIIMCLGILIHLILRR